MVKSSLYHSLPYLKIMQSIDFQVIGHVCHDWSPNGNLLGGTASYAALFAKKMNLETQVLTSFGNDFEFEETFHKINLQVIPSLQTTFFKNIYDGFARQQFLLKKANNILPNHITTDLKNAKMVLLGPIANEIDFKILEKFENSLIAICPQGWMRRWDKDGKVHHEILENWKAFEKADLVIMSEEDINFQMDLIPRLAALFKILVITKAEKGADVYFKNNKHTFPSFKSNIVDPTGAGDIFATAFLIRYYETKDILQAGIFANAAAAFCIEKKGINGLATRKDILKRIRNHSRKT